jgi:bifunctional enzyme CysN/CysC
VTRADDYRGFSGTLAAGVLRPGDALTLLPDRTPTTVERIDTFDGPVDVAVPGMAVTLVPSEDLDAGRGAVFVDPEHMPVAAGEVDATLCWMGDEPATVGKRYLLKHTSRKVRATVEAVRSRVDIASYRREEAEALELNDIGDVVLRLSEPIFADPYEINRTTGAFVLIDEHGHDTVAAGLVRRTRERSREVAPHSRDVRWHPSHLDRDRRWSALGTRGATVWLTGLPASGKSTIATALEEALVDAGQPAYLLDGDNIRHGLSGDLGFDESARWENIRRVAHVARLFADAGSVAVVSLVSPLAEARAHARRLHDEAGLPFFEVFVDTPLEECARRDPKGLYARAKAGRLSTLTGSGSPYEPPEDPEVVIPTMEEDVGAAVARLLGVLGRRR